MNLADHPLLTAVGVAIDEHARTIVVGVSGGADSVALLRALVLLRRPELQIVVAHLDHALRPQSAADARWVQQLGKSLNMTTVIERQEVAQAAANEGTGLEEAARRCRYEFLSRVAAANDCNVIAVAHTADDQAETILHQLLRGTGLAGLRGMPAAREWDGLTLLRPLLSVTRFDVLDFLTTIDQPFLTDKTNSNQTYTRNRIRHSLLPLLREEFNPQVASALCRLATQASDVQEIVDHLAGELLSTAVSERGPCRVMMNVAPLQAAHRHLVREACRLLFTQQNWPRQRMGFDGWDRLAELAQTSQAPKSFTLPEGMFAHYRRGFVTIERT